MPETIERHAVRVICGVYWTDASPSFEEFYFTDCGLPLFSTAAVIALEGVVMAVLAGISGRVMTVKYLSFQEVGLTRLDLENLGWRLISTPWT